MDAHTAEMNTLIAQFKTNPQFIPTLDKISWAHEMPGSQVFSILEDLCKKRQVKKDAKEQNDSDLKVIVTGIQDSLNACDSCQEINEKMKDLQEEYVVIIQDALCEEDVF